MAAGVVVALASRCPAGAVSTAYAFAGGGATWVRAGVLQSRHPVRDQGAGSPGPRPGSRPVRRPTRSVARGPDRVGTGAAGAARTARLTGHAPRRRSSPAASRPLSGDKGFGWVEAIGIRAGRVAFAGSEVFLETRADPFTQRIHLEPDQVAIPGLTDAHLHLAQAAIATRQVDFTDARTLEDGLARLRAAHDALPPEAWLEGHGWDSDRWGGWPSADQLETAAPGRRAALWAHDHHALWASHAALATAHPRCGRPAGRRHPSRARRNAGGRVVRVRDAPRHDPRPAAVPGRPRGGDRRGRRGARVARGRRLPRPGRRRPGPGLSPIRSPPTRASRSPVGCPLRVHACLRDNSLSAALERGYRSGVVLGGNPAGRAKVGWQKCFADGSLGSRTAALLADIEPEADRPLPPDRRRGVWMTEPAELADLVARAAAGGIATRPCDRRCRGQGRARRAPRPARRRLR